MNNNLEIAEPPTCKFKIMENQKDVRFITCLDDLTQIDDEDFKKEKKIDCFYNGSLNEMFNNLMLKYNFEPKVTFNTEKKVIRLTIKIGQCIISITNIDDGTEGCNISNNITKEQYNKYTELDYMFYSSLINKSIQPPAINSSLVNQNLELINMSSINVQQQQSQSILSQIKFKNNLNEYFTDLLKTKNETSLTKLNLNEIIQSVLSRKNYQILVGEYSGKVDDIMSALGNEFIDWIIGNKPELSKIIPGVIILVASHQSQRTQVIDPMISLLSLFCSIQKLME
jgi:hypothetical protein